VIPEQFTREEVPYMARSMPRQAFSDDEGTVSPRPVVRNVDDMWPEEPTSVERQMTMEELLLQELQRQGGMPVPAADPKKGTPLR
jgi:hypothetical protein